MLPRNIFPPPITIPTSTPKLEITSIVSAIFSAISQGHNKFSALALITLDGAYPCGSCRQIIYEFLGNIPIYIAKNTNEYVTNTISDLLPFPFG